ncbi:MAG: hypothetical protein ACRD3C_01810 [Vicinamibacterales bacterium]
MTCAVDVSPDVVDAGAELTLRGKVSCSPACDLRGHTLLIKEQGGAAAASIELTTFDGKTSDTSELVVKAPVQAGGYTWAVICPAVVKDGVAYAEASTPISFTVKPHATSVVAWDIPSTVVVGERFRMKVGIKCSSECQLTSRDFGIYDHEGVQIAAGALGGDRWPGTTGLYVAEVELKAPAGEGLYTWSVRVPRSDAGIPHAEGSISLGVRVVGHPEYVVRVETVDKVSQTPLEGARVLMHPYRAVTDERGIAEVRVAKGTYTLFVSQTSYLTFGLPVEVDADMRARAELDLEPVLERN